MASSRRRKCFPLTIVHLFFYSALGCLLPFLSLHGRDLGLTVWETSLVNVAAGVCSGLGALGAFALTATCHGRHKILAVVCLLLAAVAYTGLVLIPRVFRLPRHPLMEFDCSAAIRLEKCANWVTCADATLASANLTSFKLSDCRYVCPKQQTMPYPIHVCFRSEAGNFCEVYDSTSLTNTTVDFQSKFPAWYFDDLRKVPAADFLNYDSSTSPDYVDVCAYRPVWPLVINKQNYDDIYCRPVPDGCQIKCRVLIDGEPSPSHCLEIIGDPILTFWTYLAVRSVADTFLLSAVVILDAMFVLRINDFGGFYGRSRLWPALALAIFPPIAGALVDYYSSYSGRPDYAPPVFIFDGLVLVTCAVLIALPIEAGSRAQYSVTTSSKRRPFWTLELAVVLGLDLVLGSQWGVFDTFLRPLHAEIGCSKLVIGASAALPLICSMPFLAVSKNLIRNIGKANLLVFAFLFYGIRFAGSSFVLYPLWTVPFQAMEAFTLPLAWLALVAYAHSLVSRGRHLTVHFLLYFLHFGAGRALGTSIGALLEDLVGLAWTFRGFAIFSTVLGLLYLLLHHACIKKRRNRRRSHRGSSNGRALVPLPERRPNGDARYQKDTSLQPADARPMINPNDQDEPKLMLLNYRQIQHQDTMEGDT